MARWAYIAPADRRVYDYRKSSYTKVHRCTAIRQARFVLRNVLGPHSNVADMVLKERRYIR